MKNLKKLLAFAIVLVMMLAMCAPVMAADDTTTTINIEIKRDGSYGSSATGNREYTWYKVFSAVPADALQGQGGGHGDTGAPGDINYGNNVPAVAYVATAEVAAKLGSWNATSKTWTKAEGNLWFELSPIVGQTTYNVKWVNTSTDSATAQAAAKWLLENNVYEATGTLTPNDDGTKWTASGLDKGYYLISGSEGLNLVAATTDISIDEKNSYPTIVKEQKDADAAAFTVNPVNVAVGDTIDYQVTVTVPYDMNQDIVLTDTMSAGLTYDATTGLSFAVSGDDTATLTASGETPDYVLGTATDSGWVVTIKPTDKTRGKAIVITYQATVNDNAITDTDKENEVELKYNGDHYVMTKTVNYKIYYAGLVKYDATEPDKIYETNPSRLMPGVKFGFFVGEGQNRTAFNVKKDGAYYIPDTSTDGTASNEVVTDANGMIYFRGLDTDKTYSLTETETLDGFNMLSEIVTLTLKEDKITTVTGTDGTSTNTVDFETDKALEWKQEVVESTNYAYPWAKVENLKGTLLPSTGGIGTTIFYILGGILAVGAAVVLVARKRVSK